MTRFYINRDSLSFTASTKVSVEQRGNDDKKARAHDVRGKSAALKDDPFFKVKSPRIRDTELVTVTAAEC